MTATPIPQLVSAFMMSGALVVIHGVEILVALLAGMVLLGVFTSALREMVNGKSTLGPLITFVVAVSDLEMLGFGPYFWAIVLGVAVSLLLEHDEWNETLYEASDRQEVRTSDNA